MTFINGMFWTSSSFCHLNIKSLDIMKKIFGMSDAWLMNPLSHGPCEPAYYVVDCRISRRSEFVHSKCVTTSLSSTAMRLIKLGSWCS